MRLWHYKLLPYLPRTQLLSQWKELNTIFVSQPNHILINYVYGYSKAHLKKYADLVIAEMRRRNYKVRSMDNYYKFFEDENYDSYFIGEAPFPLHHTDRYLLQCFFNLQEKYDRKQKSFTKEEYEQLAKFCSKYLD